MRFWIGSQGSGLGDGFPSVARRLSDRIDAAFSLVKVGEIDGVCLVFYRSSNFYEGVRPWERRIRRGWTYRDILGNRGETFKCFVDVCVQIADGELLSRTAEEQYKYLGEQVVLLVDHVFGKLDGDRSMAKKTIGTICTMPYEVEGV